MNFVQFTIFRYSILTFTENWYIIVWKEVITMIADRIHEARLKKGVSMRQAAMDMGFPYTTYVNYEKGVSEPNSEALAKIAIYYQVSADFLVGTDEIEWFIEAEKFTKSMNERLANERKLLKQLFPDSADEDIATLLYQIVPAIQMMNHEGIKELGKRADELSRLREYMNQETREVIEEEDCLWEEEQRKKENPPTE